MSKLKFINKYAEKFVSEEEILAEAPKAVEAMRTLHNKTGDA